MYQPNSTHAAGFSLIEILIVFIISSLLLILALPSYLDLRARQLAESYMLQFRQNLSYARIQAVSSGSPVTLCPRQNKLCLNQWSTVPVQLWLEPTSTPAKLLRQLPLPIAKHQLFYNREQIQFRQDGSLNGFQNGTFVYCAPSFAWYYSLSLSQAGRSQLEFVELPCPYY